MQIVFCADRSVLPGLHVAAYSLLERMDPAIPQTCFTVFSDTLTNSDVALLSRTLEATKKPFALHLRAVDASIFINFPSLNGSWATYYRLLAAQAMPVERYLYVDVDTLCDVDMSELESLELGNLPVGWVPEAPLPRAVDRKVAEQLGNLPDEFYFNAGVMLVNVKEWRRQRITERAMEYLRQHSPDFWDQSALNLILHQNAARLDDKFNCIANMRRNWVRLKKQYGKIGGLVHFLDYPKPWDFLAEFIHPQYTFWNSVLKKTAMKDFRSWQSTSRGFLRTQKARAGYKKAIKDRLLFGGYSRGWLKRVKGVPLE